MSAAVLLATLFGQLPSPQLSTSAVPPPVQAVQGPPQTIVLMQYAQAPLPSGPSLLVANPPLWDRLLERTGTWLVERSRRHQHARAMTPATVAPVGVQLAPAAVAAPAPTPQQPAWVPPPPAVPSVLLVPQPQDDAVRRLFGGR